MNVGGHVEVARRLHPGRPLVWLGAALPDLAAMGGFRLLGHTTNTAVEKGITLHHRTDEAFHRHPHFTEPMGRLRAVLATDGISRGPARAVSHVGPELLLDGELLREPVLDDSVTNAFDCITGSDDELGSLVLDEHREPWLIHLAKVPTWGLPTDYADPAAIARRLHRILARRPRLAFDSEHVEAIEHRLSVEQTAIVATAPELLDDLEHELSVSAD